MTQKQFDKLNSDERIHRLMRPEEFPEFHEFLRAIHDQWIADMLVLNRRCA